MFCELLCLYIYKMAFRAVVALVLALIVQDLAAALRQKRCIVIQKQSGTHGDSAESDDDDEYRRPQPKEPRPSSDRLRAPFGDVENVTPELQKYKIMPVKSNNEYRLRRKLLRKYL